MKDVFFHSPKKYIICFLIALCFGVLYLIIQSSAYGKEIWQTMFYYINALFIGGAVIFCVGALAVINHFGGFDIFTYLGSKEKNAYHQTLLQYSENKKQKREKNKYRLVPYFVIGIFFIFVSLILMLFI